MMFKRIDHVEIVSDQLDRTGQFYTDVLGFTFAALKALAVPALLNPLYPAAQLSPLLRETSPRAVLCTPATQDIVVGLARDPGIPGVICLGQDVTLAELIAEAEAPIGLRAATPADRGVLLFSGGTTGLPKAVEHTHGRLVMAVRSMEFIWPPRRHDVFLPIAPFTHIYGFLQGLLVPLSACGKTVIPERFQPERNTEFNKAMKHVLSVLVIAASLAVAASGRVQVQPGASPLRRHRPRLPRRMRSVPRCRRCAARAELAAQSG
jgi:acyl-CoA synthetase (AMP-forming)/AMP-acid ligase II